ncbi:MAG: DUF1697 domain-containing protein [Phycisphaerae bacterium]
MMHDAKTSPVVHIALLRGINVGGKNKLPMATLVSMFEEAGGAEVRTYIQSGNVMFLASRTRGSKITDDVSQAIKAKLGLNVPVVVRTVGDFKKMIKANPFAEVDQPDRTVHIGFLKDKPTKANLSKLDPDRSTGDEYRVVGRHVFMHLPNGVAKTKLTNAYFDHALATTMTVRNWRTVSKILNIAEGF